VSSAASGVLNLATGVEATTDSMFQIGSITKVWTATVVMQLVDEGDVELDAPVCSYVPDFGSSTRASRSR
jgi:CubicO group peptidase (beta-lactamase class C family)